MPSLLKVEPNFSQVDLGQNALCRLSNNKKQLKTISRLNPILDLGGFLF